MSTAKDVQSLTVTLVIIAAVIYLWVRFKDKLLPPPAPAGPTLWDSFKSFLSNLGGSSGFSAPKPAPDGSTDVANYGSDIGYYDELTALNLDTGTPQKPTDPGAYGLNTFDPFGVNSDTPYGWINPWTVM